MLTRGLVPITGAKNIKARTILLGPLEERDLWLSGTKMYSDCMAAAVTIRLLVVFVLSLTS